MPRPGIALRSPRRPLRKGRLHELGDARFPAPARPHVAALVDADDLAAAHRGFGEVRSPADVARLHDDARAVGQCRLARRQRIVVVEEARQVHVVAAAEPVRAELGEGVAELGLDGGERRAAQGVGDVAVQLRRHMAETLSIRRAELRAAFR